jgi:hypothetical protein
LTPTPTATPTATPAPPEEIPFADIQILRPAPLSKVASPIQLHAFLIPGAGGCIRVELYGEDGRLMYRQIFLFEAPASARVNLFANLNFEIPGVAETARLRVSVDDEYGRIKALASSDVVLLSAGESDLYPAGDLLEPIVILQPMQKISYKGGTLMVNGLVRTGSDLPLFVEITDPEGKLIGSRLAGIVEGDKTEHRLFAAEVPYQVSEPTWVRVTVSERDGKKPSVRHISSAEVLLRP